MDVEPKGRSLIAAAPPATTVQLGRTDVCRPGSGSSFALLLPVCQAATRCVLDFSLATPVAHGYAQARSQTCATAVTPLSRKGAPIKGFSKLNK